MARAKPAPEAWRNAIVRYADEDPASLLANPQNWRQHPATQIAALNGALTELGWIAPVIVNETTGHMCSFTKAAERLALATFDPLGAMAGQDDAMLTSLLADISVNDAGLAEMLKDLAPDVPKILHEDDADLTPPAKPITRTGDLWLLGEHRLLCGDSTLPDAWERVLDGQRASVCLTDPPYGIGLDYDGFDDSVENVAALAQRWLPLARAHATVVVFTPGVTRQWLYPVPEWVMCWFYGGGQLRSPWGFNCWQPILAYGADPSLHSGNGCRPDAFDLNVPANAADLDHPCPKPVALWVALLERLSFKPTDIIVDCFGGAGTTLVAAEQTGRAARLIEFSPAYVDVSVRRWENLTGRKAVRDGKAVEVHA